MGGKGEQAFWCPGLPSLSLEKPQVEQTRGGRRLERCQARGQIRAHCRGAALSRASMLAPRLTHKVALTGGIHAVEGDGPKVQFWRRGRWGRQ